jgi:hypothetical protein
MNDIDGLAPNFKEYNAWRNSFKTAEQAAQAAFAIARRQEIELNTLRLCKLPDPAACLTGVEEADLKHLADLLAKPQPMLPLYNNSAYNFNMEQQKLQNPEPSQNV